jgi:hypothetical protein
MSKGTPFNQKPRDGNKKHRQRVKDRKRSLSLVGKLVAGLVSKPKGGKKAAMKRERRAKHAERDALKKAAAAKTTAMAVEEDM